MVTALTTLAEAKARQAEDLPAFSGIKLLHIKRQVANLLSLIGRDGIFDEYTRHDISHIDSMLHILDWLIPDASKAAMSPVDWLVVVLAIYFHDLGMLVTSEEFAERSRSGFASYRDNTLFAGENGADYRARVQEMSLDEAERFLYQEFVRHKHAERIRNWIMGHPSDHLGVTNRVMTEVDTLLAPLGAQCRKDLALVCESHHLDDLGDFGKYKLRQPLGNSGDETVNLQYAAILLRTCDLLHITRDRTPSIAFRVINPTDPLSQNEWAKQMAVTSVRPQLGHNREGALDEDAPKDTIEVHAYFTKESGFFGLTSYLVYAQDQIRKSYEWAQASSRQLAAPHQFPWRYIDDSNIETQGFLRDTFEFTIDQARILDLLTGHTLYNDTRVVLRELAQNALDAIRLRRLVEQREDGPATPGRLQITWDEDQRVLSVLDNGTGMTQSIIERHLLKVGASRYQDPEFRHQYPEFSAISRFGIGLLSTFMIADHVEITTCHPNDDKARHLTLRSVHGKYLIRLLDKQTHPTARMVSPHGTMVTLKVRPSAVISDILETAKRWIVVPDCEVTVVIDGKPPVQVGYPSPKGALLDVLQQAGIEVDATGTEKKDRPLIRVEEKVLGNVALAYALVWSEYFREWSFLPLQDYATSERERPLLLGTCIEGVRVEFDTPGFNSSHIAAIANAKGSGTPKTNVVRSGLEKTPELAAMLASIYTLYCDHVALEVKELHERRQFSLTWATHESRYLLSSLLEARSPDPGGRFKPSDWGLLLDSIRHLPVLLIEHHNKRSAISPAELSRTPHFWTIDSQFFRSAELLIREVAGEGSLSSLIGSLRSDSIQFPEEPVLCGFVPRSVLDQAVFAGREVDAMRLHSSQRRIDLRWTDRSDPHRWRVLPEELYVVSSYALARHGEFTLSHLSEDRPRRVPGAQVPSIHLGLGDIDIHGSSGEAMVRVLGNIYLLPGFKVTQYLLSWVERWADHRLDQVISVAAPMVLGLVLELFGRNVPSNDDFIQKWVASAEAVLRTRFGAKLEDVVDLVELYSLIDTSELVVFDPSVWSRREGS